MGNYCLMVYVGDDVQVLNIYSGDGYTHWEYI